MQGSGFSWGPSTLPEPKDMRTAATQGRGVSPPGLSQTLGQEEPGARRSVPQSPPSWGYNAWAPTPWPKWKASAPLIG